MVNLLTLATLTILGLVTSWAPRAEAFTLIKKNVKGWPTRDLSFRIDASECLISKTDLNATIEKAVALWNSIPTSYLQVSVGAPILLSEEDDSTDPVIFCDPDCSANAGGDCDFMPAYTDVLTTQNRLNFARITLNAEAGKFAEVGNIFARYPDKLVTILAHEIGHALGLGHAAQSSSLMYFDTTNRDYLSLSEDDRLGLTYLYPRDEPGGGAAFGCATVNAHQKTGGSGPFWTVALGILVLSLVRKNYVRRKA